MSAPCFVFPYRQIESMAVSAWYRATATAAAEARVERAGVRLVPLPEDGGMRGEPYVILAFEPEAGTTVRVAYFFPGAGLEAFHQPYLDAELERVLVEESQGFAWRDRDPVAPVLIETARRTALDPARPEELRALARRFLIQQLEDDWPALCSVGYEAKRATLAPLESFPEAELAAATAARFAKERDWIEARQRDWGEVCP